MKRRYVAIIRFIRTRLDALGLLGPSDGWENRSRSARWARSLLSIYDLPDLARLDLPWWTLAASEQVEKFLVEGSGKRVFEWGSGASTLWLAKRAREVTSIEHDPAWAREVMALVPSNASVVTVIPPADGGANAVISSKPGFAGLDFAGYVRAIDQAAGAYDLIVIDGRAREACLARAIHRLAPSGMIVFDNVDRKRYRDAIESCGDLVDVVWTRGLTPCLPYPTRTALVTLKEA